MSPEIPKMPEISSEPQPVDQNNFLRNLREITAVGISAVVVLGFGIMIGVTYQYIYAPKDSEVFQRAKDLLLIINPFFGIVLGYYFNKVSTESRAENAEKTAQSATASKEKSEAAKDEAKRESEAAKTALTKLSTAADMVLNNFSPAESNRLAMAAEGTNAINSNTALDQLRIANNKAKEIVV